MGINSVQYFMLEYVSEEWFTMLVSSCLSPGVSLGIKVHQTPSELIRKRGNRLQSDAVVPAVCWTERPQSDRTLVFPKHWRRKCFWRGLLNFWGSQRGHSQERSLLIRLKDPVSSGVYYCSASIARQHTPTATHNKNPKLCGSYPRWFGMETSCQVFPRPPALEANFCFILVSTNRVLYFLPTNAHCLLIKTLPTHVLSSAANQSNSSQNTIRKDNKNIPSTRGCSLVVLRLSHTKIVGITSSLLNICTK